uniref:ABC transporter substrate binding protein n=1 Tax=Candidatus Berkiella aquae TaxID=295108 RepID=A0A0Q9YX00_9GAMM
MHRIEASLFGKLTTKPKLIHLLSENLHEKAAMQQLSQACLVVTIGSESLRQLLNTKTQTPILSVLSRRAIFHHLLQTHQRTLNDPLHPISAIYLDQPLERQLNLITCLFKHRPPKQVGVILGTESLYHQESLQKSAPKFPFHLNTVVVDKFENPATVLDILLNDAKVILAIPDSRIYNPKTARGMLLTAFHKRVPLVGYSKTFVNNGAIAAVYSNTKQLADQTADEIIKIVNSKDKKLSLPRYPDEFTISVNHQVARSLGIPVDNEVVIKQAMKQMEST